MILIDVLFLLICFFHTTLQLSYKKLDLDEGAVCRNVDGAGSDHRCLRRENCTSLAENLKKFNYLDICSFDRRDRPIFCCPPTTTTTTAVVGHPSESLKVKKTSVLEEVCRKPEPSFAVGGSSVLPGEVKHMTLIGYGENRDDAEWGCAGSLISERWILTAAHCKELPYYGVARWARLGVINIMNTDGPHDYEIVRHVVHPEYKPPSLYNDIALFRSDKIIDDDGLYVFPVCLNSNTTFAPSVLTTAGWGRSVTDTAASVGQELLKADLNVLPAKRCNDSYFSNPDGKALKFGVSDDRMICAGPVGGGPADASCIGDSGGPLHIKDDSPYYPYVLMGVTSFGKSCADPDAPGVYTRVSYYYSWIDSIVHD